MVCKIFLLACLCVVCFDLVQSTIGLSLGDNVIIRNGKIATDYCPDNGKAENGHWRIDEKGDKKRCILKCSEGFKPSGCHVLRKEGDSWNYKVPTCEKWISIGDVVVAVAAGAGAVAAAPVVLSAAGFTTAGVAAGSLAAGLQGPAVAAGSWFATFQRAGAAGLAATTKGYIFAGPSIFTRAVSSFFGPTCEKE